MVYGRTLGVLTTKQHQPNDSLGFGAQRVKGSTEKHYFKWLKVIHQEDHEYESWAALAVHQALAIIIVVLFNHIQYPTIKE